MEEDVVINLGSDPKFQRFSASVERSLKGFELSREWQDLISCLSQLNKVLLAYVHFRVLPYKHLVCRRLSQCLHPSLPGGVHLKVLDVYKVIFDRIGHEGLAHDLFLYSSGLFPVLEHGSVQVRPVLLDLYEQYYIPIGLGLLPALSGFISALLPCLEDGSEYTDKAVHVLDSLYSVTSAEAFICALWNILLSFQFKLPAHFYINLHLSKGTSDVCNAIKQVDSFTDVVVPAICSSLQDPNVLVQRYTLDLIIQLFPLKTFPISHDYLEKIMIAVLRCLLKRDLSIVRRVFAWLLVSVKVQNSDTVLEIEDFNVYVKPYLLTSIKGILTEASHDISSTTEKSTFVQPYRLLKILYEQSELIAPLYTEILPNIALCLKTQLGTPDAYFKRDGKHCSQEILYSANQLLTSLDSDVLWNWMKDFVSAPLKKSKSTASDTNEITLQERVSLVIYLLEVLPLGNMECALCLYLPNLLLHLLVTLTQNLKNLPLQSLCCITFFITNVLALLKRHVQLLMKPPSTLSAAHFSATSSHQILTQKVDYNPLEMSLGNLVLALLHHSQLAVQIYVSTHICDMEEISCSEIIAIKIKDALTCNATLSSMDCCKCVEGNCGDDDLHRSFTSMCTMLMETLSLLQSLQFDQVSFGQSIWLEALVISSLCGHDTHIFLTSLDTLLELHQIATNLRHNGLDILCNVINMFNTEPKLIQVFTVRLWTHLSPVFCNHHEKSANLLRILFYATSPAICIEAFFLNMFTVNSIEPYEMFATFWQYLSKDEYILTTCLNKSILRMIEGLQSKNSAISHCTSTWLISVCHKKQLEYALQPLYTLLKESCPYRLSSKKEENENEDIDFVHGYSKYYYESLDKEVQKSELPESELSYPVFYFTQLLDSPRYSYGLTLFLSIISVSPELVCSTLFTTYPVESPCELGDKQTVTVSSESSKSLMEIILNECMELICSDYPIWMNAIDTDLQTLFDVKVMSTSLVLEILACWIKLLNLSKINEELNTSYITGLMALCEVQKTILTTLLYLTSDFTFPYTSVSTKTTGISFILMHQSLLLQLLRCLYTLIQIEAIMMEDSHVQSVVTSSESLEYVYVPSYAITSQSMFHSLVLHTFTQTIDCNVHLPLLMFIRVSLPYMRESLELIAPNLVTSICQNIVSLLKEKPSDDSDIHTCHKKLLVSYLQTLTSIAHYCLTFVDVETNSLPLHYQYLNHFWDLDSFYTPRKTLSTKNSEMQTKHNFSFLGIFSGIFSRNINEQVVINGCGDVYRGVNTSAGQKVLCSLQLVYNTLANLWKAVCADDKHQKRTLTQDINILIRHFLEPILKNSDVVFYSSIAYSWMQWNLAGNAKLSVKDNFIQMLHAFKLCSLESLISSINCTLLNMNRSNQPERPKYLLHFLYRYISSSMQNSDELLLCYDLLVQFLKECHVLILSMVELGDHSNTPLLCMLMSICHVLVCRVPVTELRQNKKKRRELQDIIYRLSDSLSQATRITADSIDYNTSLEVKPDTKFKGNSIEIPTSSGSPDTHIFSSGHQVQAMAVLANVLSHFVDCVYDSSEKDRISSLLKTVLHNIWPSLHNYSLSTPYSYIYAVKLLASLSGFQVTRKCWKHEVMEWFLNTKYFVMKDSCIFDWKLIIDNLMSQDKLMFQSLLSRIPSSSAGGMGNIFSSLEIERVQRAKLFKRIAFVIVCGEQGQYSGSLHDIQEKLLDSIRWYSGPILNAEVLMLFKVLLLKLSALDLNSLWPALLAELTLALSELHCDICLELTTPLKTKHDKILWYYNACKLLDTALSVPLNQLPHFQMVSWGYFGEKGSDNNGIIGDILDSYKKEAPNEDITTINVIPNIDDISTALHFVPVLLFLKMKAHVFSDRQSITIEKTVLVDFVEH